MNWLPRPAEGRTYASPSLLAADFTDLAGELASLAAAGADLLHLDVMDGHFVPNLTIGPFIVEAIGRASDLPRDAHLMLTRPDRYLAAFADAGADAITVHVECEADVGDCLAETRRLGAAAGISLNPPTPLAAIEPYLGQADLVLVMTVMPGFGGQAFDASGLDKIARLAEIRHRRGLDFLISVDGGINAEIGARCRQAGADILVSGSWLFKARDRAAAVRQLQG